MNLAIIPARGNSKRIPRKNIKPFHGKPMIAWAIENALQSGMFDEVMVSTDDLEIATIAQQYGAKVPFMRSAKNSDDTATTKAVLLEVLEEYQKRGATFSRACCIYPCTPLLSPAKLAEALRLLDEQHLDCVFPVLPYSYPIQRAFVLNDGKAQLMYPEFKDSRTQDLQPTFHDSGQFYWFDVSRFLATQELWTNNIGVIRLSEMEAQDIDTEDDWAMAELKFKLRKLPNG